MSTFLNASNHAPGIPLDFISFHHYAGSQRDGGSDGLGELYEAFFASADGFLGNVAAISAIRDQLNPTVRLDADEVGVILADDNDPKWTSAEPGFGNIYWNAAAASFGYLYGTTSVLGLDVLGESQLTGYPSFNFTRGAPYNGLWTAPPQYPSVSMLNWTDGSGTARYAVLQLLIQEFVPGLPAGTAPAAISSTPAPSNPFCGSVPNLSNLGLACSDPGAAIDQIVFASYGTPTGSCPSWGIGSCNDANSTAIVESYCLNKNSCTVPAFTQVFGDPCYNTFKYLDVVAHCSPGGGSPTGGSNLPVYAQAYVEAAGTGAKKALIVNKSHLAQQVSFAGAAQGTLRYVDLSTGFGPAASITLTADTFTLQPFSVAVLRLV